MHLEQTLEEDVPDRAIGRKTALIEKEKEKLALKSKT